MDLIETKSIVAPFFLLYSTAVPSEHLYLPSYLSLLISIVLVTLVMRLVFIFWWLLWFVSGSTCLNVVVLHKIHSLHLKLRKIIVLKYVNNLSIIPSFTSQLIVLLVRFIFFFFVNVPK